MDSNDDTHLTRGIGAGPVPIVAPQGSRGRSLDMWGPHTIARRGTKAGAEHAGFQVGKVSREDGGWLVARDGQEEGTGFRLGPRRRAEEGRAVGNAKSLRATIRREGPEEAQAPQEEGLQDCREGPPVSAARGPLQAITCFSLNCRH